MSSKNPIVWTPDQRQAVIDFLKLYTTELEEAKDNSEKGYGLEGIQRGVLHLADKVLPSGVTYTVNQGLSNYRQDEVQVLLTDAAYQKFEESRSSDASD